MDKIFIILLIILICTSCSNDEIDHIELTAPINVTLPKNPKTLNILAIGNSFTEDATTLLPSILEDLDIKNVTLGRLTYNSGSLENHYMFYNNKSNVYQFSITENNIWNDISNTYSINEAIKYTDWDIIVIQQASYKAGIYNSFQPYLNGLLNNIYRDCHNKNVVFGWHLTWSYSTDCNRPQFSDYNYSQERMYNAIIETTTSMIKDTGIALIIPSGITIQNLRNTSLNNPPKDITRDGFHIDLGIGRYALAYTWFQSIITPCFNRQIQESSYIPPFTEGIKVNKDNLQIVLDVVQKSCKDPLK